MIVTYKCGHTKNLSLVYKESQLDKYKFRLCPSCYKADFNKKYEERKIEAKNSPLGFCKLKGGTKKQNDFAVVIRQAKYDDFLKMFPKHIGDKRYIDLFNLVTDFKIFIDYRHYDGQRFFIDLIKEKYPVEYLNILTKNNGN